MSIQEDISKIVQEVWEDQTIGEAFQSSARGLVNYEISHRVRMIMQRMVDDAVIKNIVRPCVEARVAELKPKIEANINARLDKMVENLQVKLQQITLEALVRWSHQYLGEATSNLTQKFQSIIYQAWGDPKEPT